jgi:hypothetical protein
MGRWPGTSALWLLALWVPAGAQQYSLNFNKSSTRTSWSHRLPSWQYSAPVRFSAAGDTTSRLSISTSASMNFTLDERGGRRIWQDNASVNSSVNYPILGPRAAIGIGANASVRNATLQQQKLRNQTFNFRFQYNPLQQGRFKTLSVNVTPGLITASRASRANLDSTIEEKGIQYNASLRVSPELTLAGKKLSNSVSLSKQDNTLKNNKNRSESFSTSLSYTLPGQVRASLNFSESRSQVGVTRAVVEEQVLGEQVRRDTSVAAELSENRGTGLSSSANFDLGRFKVENSFSYRENLRTNTASGDPDPSNRYFGTDRESQSWNLETTISGKLAERLVARASFRLNTGDERFLPVRVLDTRQCASHFTIAPDGTCRDPSSDLSNRDLFLNGSLNWTLSEEQTLSLTAWADGKQAENPGASEQDRDMYGNSFSLKYEGLLASGVKLHLEVKHSFLHRVNLHATRAGDNARNRDIGLDAGTSYERLGIGLAHNFSISAKRTLFDFDRQVNRREAARKSNIRRGWSMNHSLRRPLLEHVHLNLRYAYTADDFGTLIVERGAQVVEEDNSDHSVNFGMSYNPSAAFSASVSYSYRLDRQWKHQYADFEESRLLSRRNQHRNLSLNLNYNPTDSPNRLTLRGSRSRQRSGTFDSFGVTYSRTL